MLIKEKNQKSEWAIFTTEDIEKGALIFSHEEWIEEETGWFTLSINEINELPEDRKRRFLKYSYDLDFNVTTGTFDWKLAKNISNYINHSCDPNMWYDLHDNIEAKRYINAGEELTMDYGTFIVNMDQDFLCNCGSTSCRKYIRANDWENLIPEYHLHYPVFLHNKIKMHSKFQPAYEKQI
jgi:SET domain-containing protein